MSPAARAAYADIVKWVPGHAVTSRAGPVARAARRGLIQVLAGPDTPPAWWHRPWPLRAYLMLSLTTLALVVLNLASIHTRPTVSPAPPASCRASPCYYFHYPPLSAGQVLLVIAVVTPLLLAARYPLLGWRIGWLALLLAPLVPVQWRGGWPWGPAQVLVLLVVFCVAGVRYRRPVLWWMWALSLIPWWLWLVRDLPDLNGPLSATVLFTAGTVALDSVSSRWRTQRDAGRPDRAHRAGAGPAGRAGGAHPDRAGTA